MSGQGNRDISGLGCSFMMSDFLLFPIPAYHTTVFNDRGPYNNISGVSFNSKSGKVSKDNFDYNQNQWIPLNYEAGSISWIGGTAKIDPTTNLITYPKAVSWNTFHYEDPNDYIWKIRGDGRLCRNGKCILETGTNLILCAGICKTNNQIQVLLQSGTWILSVNDYLSTDNQIQLSSFRSIAFPPNYENTHSGCWRFEISQDGCFMLAQYRFRDKLPIATLEEDAINGYCFDRIYEMQVSKRSETDQSQLFAWSLIWTQQPLAGTVDQDFVNNNSTLESSVSTVASYNDRYERPFEIDYYDWYIYTNTDYHSPGTFDFTTSLERNATGKYQVTGTKLVSAFYRYNTLVIRRVTVNGSGTGQNIISYSYEGAKSGMVDTGDLSTTIRCRFIPAEWGGTEQEWGDNLYKEQTIPINQPIWIYDSAQIARGITTSDTMSFVIDDTVLISRVDLGQPSYDTQIIYQGIVSQFNYSYSFNESANSTISEPSKRPLGKADKYLDTSPWQWNEAFGWKEFADDEYACFGHPAFWVQDLDWYQWEPPVFSSDPNSGGNFTITGTVHDIVTQDSSDGNIVVNKGSWDYAFEGTGLINYPEWTKSASGFININQESINTIHWSTSKPGNDFLGLEPYMPALGTYLNFNDINQYSSLLANAKFCCSEVAFMIASHPNGIKCKTSRRGSTIASVITDTGNPIQKITYWDGGNLLTALSGDGWTPQYINDIRLL